jgi:peptide/nickel transport system substrate-binding protein
MVDSCGVTHRRKITALAGRSAALALTVLLGVAGVVGCSAGSAATSSATVLRLGTTFSIDSVNPFDAINITSYDVFSYIYPHLVQYNASLTKIEPDFATSWTVSPSGTSYVFHLHTGAKWTDGKPLTSSDVAWTINTLLKFASGGAASVARFLTNVTSASAPEPGTVTVTLSKPTASFLANIVLMPILPEHIWQKHTSGKDGAGLKTFANVPSAGRPVVGNGPFELTQYQNLGTAILTRYSDYYGPKPTLADVAIQYFTNADDEVTALKDGQINAVVNVPVSSAQSLAKDHGIDVSAAPGLFEYDLIFNDNPKKNSNKETANPLLHEAFDYAIDRSAIIRYALDGYGKPAESVLPPASGTWWDPSVQPPSFDLAKAAALLNEAGYKMGKNGIRIADGHPMSYDVDMAADLNGVGNRIFQILQPDFAKIGVQLTLRPLDDSTMGSAITSPSSQFDLGMWAWNPPVDPSTQLDSYTCTEIGAENETDYCNPAFDKLYAQQNATLSVSQRMRIVYAMQQMLDQARPELMYVYPDVIDAWSTKWHGFGNSGITFFGHLTTAGLQNVRES